MSVPASRQQSGGGGGGGGCAVSSGGGGRSGGGGGNSSSASLGLGLAGLLVKERRGGAAREARGEAGAGAVTPPDELERIMCGCVLAVLGERERASSCGGSRGTLVH